MPRGANAKREREYSALESKFQHEGRYRGREKEVAARIVNKQRAQYGETKSEKQKDREGKSPDRHLPIADYQHQTIAQISQAIGSLSSRELQQVRRYEQSHKQRKGVLSRIEAQLARGRSTTRHST